MLKKILIADIINIEGIRILKEHFTVTVLKKNDYDEIISAVNSIKPNVLIVRSFRKINKEFLDKLQSDAIPELICTASAGFDNIDKKYAKKLNINVLNVKAANHIPAAEHTFALILTIYKNIITNYSDLKNGKFVSNNFSNNELYGKTIGVIGVGHVGSYVAGLAKGFNMNVIGNDIRDLSKKYKWIKFLSLNELLKISDIITVHTPLNETTFELINKDNIRLIKRNAIVINGARGGIINENALIEALKNNRIKYAGLDVFENEPDIKDEFKELNNVIATPHIAGKTRESHVRISVQLAEIIVSYFEKG